MRDSEGRQKFGHLETDEPFVGAKPIQEDMDRSVLRGCGVIAAALILVYASIAIPIMLQTPLLTKQELTRAVGIAATLSLLTGIGFTAKTGLSGLSGSIAGLIAGAVFVWLRLEGAAQPPAIEGAPKAEFGSFAAWAVPLAVFVPMGLVWYGVYKFNASMERRREDKP